MAKPYKIEEVTELTQLLENNDFVGMSHYHGVNVEKITQFRRKMRAAGAKVRISKNTLAKIALNNSGLSHLENFFTGPVVMVFAKDPVAASKITVDFAKENEAFKIIGGSLNKVILQENEIKSLSDLPSIDVIRSQLIGLISAPATKIARIMQTPARNVACVIQAKSEKN